MERSRTPPCEREAKTHKLVFGSEATWQLVLLELTKRVVRDARDAARLGDKTRFILASILNGDEAETFLNRVFPVVTYLTEPTVAHSVGGSCTNGSYVGCSEDMCTSNSRFTFVPTPEPPAGGSSKVIYLGNETKFGLKSYAWRQSENRFVCEQIARRNYLQSRTWLLTDEEWAAVGPFRSLAYARPLRVGDVFLLRSVGQRTNISKFMASVRGSDHLELRNSPSAVSYVVVLSDAHGRFLCEP